MYWLVLFGALIAATGVGLVYITCRTHRFSFLKRLGEKHKILAWLLAMIPVALVLLTALKNTFTMFVTMVHLLAFWLICDLAGLIYRKIRKKQWTKNYCGAAALLITAVYLGIGLYNGYHIVETDYAFTTEKDLGGSLRIVEIADSHLGATLHGDSFGRAMERIQDTEPDLLLVVGDFVDDDSSRADMLAACQALGRLETRYGVYFVYGNHDKGYYDYRNFTTQELRQALEENGVTILEDEAVLVDGRFYILGRQDRSAYGRAGMDALTAGMDESKYIIAMDHQPNDYAGEAGKADLVLSGHTHGGHVWPVGQIATLGGLNDLLYGTVQREGTDFVVTSGISAWAFPYKTGTVAEYVVIDISEE